MCFRRSPGQKPTRSGLTSRRSSTGSSPPSDRGGLRRADQGGPGEGLGLGRKTEQGTLICHVLLSVKEQFHLQIKHVLIVQKGGFRFYYITIGFHNDFK